MFLPWFKGPSFLLLPESDWPLLPQLENQIIDVASLFINKRERIAVSPLKVRSPSEGFLVLIDYYSDFNRLIRAVCYVCCVVKACTMVNKHKRKSFLNP